MRQFDKLISYRLKNYCFEIIALGLTVLELRRRTTNTFRGYMQTILLDINILSQAYLTRRAAPNVSYLVYLCDLC
jgi:hypothetical protein